MNSKLLVVGVVGFFAAAALIMFAVHRATREVVSQLPGRVRLAEPHAPSIEVPERAPTYEPVPHEQTANVVSLLA